VSVGEGRPSRRRRPLRGAGSRRGLPRVAAVALVLSLAAAAPAQAARAGRTESAGKAKLRLGTQTLSRCATRPLAYCGTLMVPLDRGAAGSPSIGIAFRFYPATAGPAQGTVVPVEGGPGYPSGESVLYSSAGARAGYAPMYGPLLERWNLLAIDNRGTGGSAVLRCPALQTFEGPTGTAAFQRAVGECAAAINQRWHYRGGAPVHASDLFTTAAASEDMAAVVHALGISKIDLYGDSYGSFFAQAFAARFPGMLRSLTLDSTYSLVGLDPWYRSTVAAMPGDFETACARAPACAQAEPLPVWSRIAQLAASLRAKPLHDVVPGAGGRLEAVTMGVVGLVDLVNDAAADVQIYRDLDAAARAALGGDPAPLLRLYAQRLAVDEAYFGLPVGEYSVPLYFAVGCLDYPQLFAMASTPAVRGAQLAAAEAALPSGTFAPFTTAEWVSQDQNTESYTACLRWPAPERAEAPAPPQRPLLPSTLPVLVLGGELDTWTPPGDVAGELPVLGGDSRFVELANSTHVVGEGDTECGSELVRAFVERPEALATLDTSCAPSVPPIHAVGAFPASIAAQSPLSPEPGTAAPPGALRLAAAALDTAGDALARWQATEDRRDRGLHGGSVAVAADESLLTLHGDELIGGVPVSGTVRPAGAAASAELTLPGSRGAETTLSAAWATAGSAPARVEGTVAGVHVAGTMPAP
jgi:pimeloyl-ACP methyl ester carboxylesterase